MYTVGSSNILLFIIYFLENVLTVYIIIIILIIMFSLIDWLVDWFIVWMIFFQCNPFLFNFSNIVKYNFSIHQLFCKLFNNTVFGNISQFVFQLPNRNSMISVLLYICFSFQSTITEKLCRILAPKGSFDFLLLKKIKSRNIWCKIFQFSEFKKKKKRNFNYLMYKVRFSDFIKTKCQLFDKEQLSQFGKIIHMSKFVINIAFCLASEWFSTITTTY